MITLNDYLYDGDTVLKILHRYTADLRRDGEATGNEVDLTHADFLEQLSGILEREDFLTSQSRRLRELYSYMVQEYPFLSFTFKGRIKSLIRTEEKFNGTVVERVRKAYLEEGALPSMEVLTEGLGNVRDLLAYRIVLSLPRCHLTPGEDPEEADLRYLYEIAGLVPEFLRVHGGFTPLVVNAPGAAPDPRLPEAVRLYYKNFVWEPTPAGYRSLHMTLYDSYAGVQLELQLRTKSMNDFATIGPANHQGYELRQGDERAVRRIIPEGACPVFDQALERGRLLRDLDLSQVDVNMFGAVSNTLVNDGCGLYRGRLITPFEHLSRFQSGR